MTQLLYNIRAALASSLNFASLLPKTISPWVVNLNLVENCQAKCITCDYWRDNHKQHITTERAIGLFKEFNQLGVKNVRLEGGEPLLRKDLFYLLDSCEKHWFERVVLATNGLLLGRLAERINQSIITHVTVSLDAVGIRNDRIRGIEGYYNKVISALPRIEKKIKVVSTFTKELIPDMEELIQYCLEHGYTYDVNLPDKHMYFFSSNETRAAVEELWPSPSDISKGLEILSRYNVLPKYVLANAEEFLTNRKFKFNHCIQGYVEINIDSKGGVRTGCNVFAPIGNVLDDELKNIVASQPYRVSVHKMYKLDCPLCTCGYGISALYKKPWSNIGYALKRIK